MSQLPSHVSKAILLGCVLLTSSCSSGDGPRDDGTDSGPALDASSDIDAGASEDSGSLDAGTTDAALVVGIPELLSVEVVEHGTMELAWENPESGCDSIRIERSQDEGEWTTAQTVSGVATEIQDEPGHANGMYCYRLRCIVDGETGEPSNEECAVQ